jgi:Holliday junction resolvasome RuvABC ATP-dependent DNA helicase subunit
LCLAEQSRLAANGKTDFGRKDLPRNIRLHSKCWAANMSALDNIIGQELAVTRLRQFATHFSQRGEAPDHILIVGAEGMGKRAIANAVANELGVSIYMTNGTLLEKKGDVTAILTSLDQGDLIFLENIHRLRQPLKQILLPALQDFKIDLIIGQGAGARVHPYVLNRFTCVASVPEEAAITSELHDAFPLVLRLQPYSKSELARIAIRVAENDSKLLTLPAAQLIAAACDGSPHQAETLVSRLAKGSSPEITESDVRNYLSILGTHLESHTAPGLSGVDNLSGIDFELLVGSLLSRMGFQIEMTKESGDGGVDIIATLDKPFLRGRYLVQCKRFAIGSNVGAPIVREFYGALRADRNAVKGIFITTSFFTNQARDFARDLPIDLIDRDQLCHLLREYDLLTN